MSEVIFILTTVFVAYVVFSVVSDEKKTVQKNNKAGKPTSAVTPDVKVEAPKAAASVKETAALKAEVSAEKVAEDDNSLRNPETGEVAKIPNNYRFSKRWIKEALVKEGLLDKIYKNNELDDDANAKIHQALADLHAIEKYQA
ncbi:MAG: hypothetical protein GQ569_09800 [Methylococcaceae bacterium]|nr:hypothetical protein [Methylococcaceae bacterium]